MEENNKINMPTLAAAIAYTNSHGGGGGGGTSNYNDLSNKPQIGGTTLTGNKSASDLGLVAAVDGKGLSTNDYTDADKAIVGGVTAALAGKQNVLTAGSNIKIDNNTISVNRWAVPAGKVVYTVITSDENYGQNVHVQRHTLGGGFIDDRTFLCEMYKTVEVDGLISIYNPYSSFRITLLENSDEQQAGYSYTVNPITTPTSNSFTFTLQQEENDNDLIIREELDAVSSAVSAIKDGQSIDSFADVETALATKADLTDLAPAFSAASAYAVGKYVSYEGNIYKCTSAHSAGEWVAGDFTIVAVGSELESKQDTLTFDDTPTDNSNNPVKSNGIYDALATKANTDMVAADFNAGTSYTAGNYCIYEGKFYKFKASHSGAWSAADVDEIKIAGELSSLKSGLTNVESRLENTNNKFGGVYFLNTSIAVAGSKDINTTKLSKFMIITSNNTSGRGLYICFSDGSNNANFEAIKSASGLTLTAGSGKIAIANGSTGNEREVQVTVLVMIGDLSIS